MGQGICLFLIRDFSADSTENQHGKKLYSYRRVIAIHFINAYRDS